MAFTAFKSNHLVDNNDISRWKHTGRVSYCREKKWISGPTSCTDNSPTSNASLETLRARIDGAPIVACDQPAWQFHGNHHGHAEYALVVAAGHRGFLLHCGIERERLPMRKLPGDREYTQQVESMIRVDHAGEYGAMRIYSGQLAVMKHTPARTLVEHMRDQERHHLETFTQIVKDRQVRPTVLMPLWHVGGFLLGAATALLGEKAAFACTVAVESVIDEHYASQHAQLRPDENTLAQTIETFRAQEVEHHDTSLAQGAADTPLYPVLTAAIKATSRLAIWLSSRL